MSIDEIERHLARMRRRMAEKRDAQAGAGPHRGGV
jgi:hypothetical protein